MRLLHPFLALLLLMFTVTGRAAPVIVPDQSPLTLDDLGLYTAGYQLRGGPEVLLGVGWTSGLDSPTGAACQPSGVQNGEEAWLLHCPWKGPTGVTFQDFTLRLPRIPRITLRGATALRADAIGKSDGVTYRVFVNGDKRLDVNRTDSAWRPFAIDLSPEAGRTVTLRFETDPGPNENSSFDFSLWGDRRLDLPGYVPHVVHHPAPPPLDLRRLASRQNGSAAPLSGFDGTTAVRATRDGTVLTYRGPDGTLEYHWTPGQGASLLGRVTLRATMTGDAPVEVPVAYQAHLDWTGDATLTGSKFQGTTLTRTYTVGGQPATVTVRAGLHGKSLVFDVACDRGVVRQLDGGVWGPVMRRRAIAVPYYSNPALYLARENLFANAFLDWTDSRATSQDGDRATYEALTDGTRNPLRERLIYTAAWHLDEILPNIPNPPSPFRADLSKRVVLDIWGDTFPGVQAHLQALAAEGLGPGVALLHVWQHFGYDNGLPQHVPANADQGGDPAMAALTATAQADGIRMALHENYVDYYPNYPSFAETDIARNPDGSRIPAWYNSGTKIQSFAVKPARILPLAKTQGPEVLRRYGSNACYLDVHSAVPPWFHVDAEASQPGAGTFAAVWDAHRALWAYERALHHGPVFGEGSNHWYWSGYLDGVEAQFGQGWPSNGGLNAPLLTDFDLLKIHPLQLNHGMGYYERWWSQGPNEERGLLSLLDQYRMQEVAFGHEGFLGGEAWHDPGFAWLESHLMTPLTARSALAHAVAIDYWTGGRWLDATAALKAGTDWSRVRVRYDNGLTVWANGAATPLPLGAGVMLPAYGWRAQGAGLTAGTTLRAGVVSDLAETSDSVFVNARPAADWRTPGQTRLRPTVAEFSPLGPRRFRATYHWAVGQTVPEDYHCFVHFVGTTGNTSDENIRFQQDHALAVPTSQWKSGQTVSDGPWDITVPDSAAPGDYLWTVGLFGSGGRLVLQGPSDPHNRIILGTLHVAADGGVTFTPPPPAPQDTAPINRDARVLDFGPIRTNGSVFVRREGADWVLRPFPRDRAFTVELRAARFGHPASIPVTAGWWRLRLTGAATYRWPAAAEKRASR